MRREWIFFCLSNDKYDKIRDFSNDDTISFCGSFSIIINFFFDEIKQAHYKYNNI